MQLNVEINHEKSSTPKNTKCALYFAISSRRMHIMSFVKADAKIPDNIDFERLWLHKINLKIFECVLNVKNQSINYDWMPNW